MVEEVMTMVLEDEVPEEEETMVEEVVIPEEVTTKKSLKLPMDLYSSALVMAPELNTTLKLITPKKHLPSLAKNRKRCYNMIENMEQ